MKCPYCGGEVGNTRYCQYCGSQISYDKKREQEKMNIEGCQRCGSSNIQFAREKQGEYQDGYGKSIVYRTVGFCKDCGYTWYPDQEDEDDAYDWYQEPEKMHPDVPKKTPVSAPKKNGSALTVLGWIFLFPFMVLTLIWRKDNTMGVMTKVVVTILYLAFLALIGQARKPA
ncbi:MAG: hypothetical protein IKE38_03560 [Erysipelotrichaceae bacterium]|nr:hypothetical protein [Erysipelotrichaceae bacterium]